jgi:DNA-binding MarR family transcriptional regulator
MNHRDWERVMKATAAREAAWQVMAVLAHHANDKTRLCWPSWNLLLEETHLARSSLSRAIKRLLELGEVQVVQHSGGQRATLYVVTLLAPRELSERYPSEVAQRDRRNGPRGSFRDPPEVAQNAPEVAQRYTPIGTSENVNYVNVRDERHEADDESSPSLQGATPPAPPNGTDADPSFSHVNRHVPEDNAPLSDKDELAQTLLGLHPALRTRFNALRVVWKDPEAAEELACTHDSEVPPCPVCGADGCMRRWSSKLQCFAKSRVS